MSAVLISEIAQARARRWTSSATTSRWCAVSFLESRSHGWWKPRGSTTAAATSGPAKAPLPTSSMPQSRKPRQSSTPKVVVM